MRFYGGTVWLKATLNCEGQPGMGFESLSGY